MARKKRNSKQSNKPRSKSKKRGGSPNRPNRTKPQDARQDGLIDVELFGMANGGSAIGSHNKRTVFIPYTIPGEVVRAEITDSKGRVDFAQGRELLDASADRTYPACPHFGQGKCWGCQWQHIDYRAQLLLKQDVLADQLSRVGKIDDATIERTMHPVIPSPQQWGYNNQLTLERNPKGELGIYRMDGRTIQPIDVCPITHPDLVDLFSILDIDYPDMQRLTLWRATEGQTMVIITMTSEQAPELLIDLPTSINIILPDNEPVNLIGDTLLHYQIAGRDFRVTVGSDIRANTAQIEPLIGQVLDMLALSPTDLVLDLYAGVGIFSAFMAPRAELVTLVESYPPTATDAEENLSDFENVDIVEGSVEDVLPVLIDAQEQYQAALIDPPSSGISKTAMQHLTTMQIPRLVYLSSDAASFARDAAHLIDKGYRLEKIQPFDFAPQTYYIDLAALFVRD